MVIALLKYFGYKLVVLSTLNGLPIEDVFHKLQNTGRNPEQLLNKTVGGFATHIAAKIASHTLRLFLRRHFGIDVLTFQSLSPL